VNLERAHGRLADILPEQALSTFAGAGLPEVPCAAPGSAEEAAEVLRLAAAERWKVLPLGSGTKLGWARLPPRVDLVLSSTRLTGIVAYEPADGTLTARAGTPWSELRAAVEGTHQLSPELPTEGAGTFGGVLSAGASGLDRLRHGPLRHQVLGLTALQPDASLAHSGGRVVKNVTGYDLHRLWCGSHGTLGFLLEGTLRLYPAATHEAVFVRDCATRAEGLALGEALARAQLLPLAALLMERPDGGQRLELVLAGRRELVEDELARVRRTLGDGPTLTGPEARARRSALAALEGAQDTGLTLDTRPSRLAALCARIEAALQTHAPEARLTLEPLLGRARVGFAAPPARETRLALARQLEGESLAWRTHPPDFRPPLCAPPAALELMRRIKRSVDPAALFAAGRFHDDF